MARNPRSEHNFIYPKFSGFPLENRQIIGERDALSSLRDITKCVSTPVPSLREERRGDGTSCTPVPSLREERRGDGTSCTPVPSLREERRGDGTSCTHVPSLRAGGRGRRNKFFNIWTR